MDRRGFTLVELIITFIIIGIMASVTLPLTKLSYIRERETMLRESLREYRKAIDKMKEVEGTYPVSLEMLVSKRYLRRVYREPFGYEFEYTGSGTECVGIWQPFEIGYPVFKAKDGSDVYDVRTTNPNRAIDGTLYKEW